MQNPVENYWKVRLQDLKKKLEGNNFDAFVVASAADAKDLVLQTILPAAAPKSVSWAGSMTFGAAGISEVLSKMSDLTIINPYEPNITPAESYERRRQGLLSDLYFAGTNAVTEDGQLVNLDGAGNRVAALTFGPKNVVVLVGRNKVVSGLEEAFIRVKTISAPMNVMRLDKKTPCLTTAECQDCGSPERICNTWTITERSSPKGRVKVILINQDLGF